MNKLETDRLIRVMDRLEREDFIALGYKNINMGYVEWEYEDDIGETIHLMRHDGIHGGRRTTDYFYMPKSALRKPFDLKSACGSVEPE